MVAKNFFNVFYSKPKKRWKTAFLYVWYFQAKNPFETALKNLRFCNYDFIPRLETLIILKLFQFYPFHLEIQIVLN